MTTSGDDPALDPARSPEPKTRKRRRRSDFRWTTIAAAVAATLGAVLSLITALIARSPASKHPVPTITITVTASPAVAMHPQPAVTRYIAIAASDSNNTWVILSALGVVIGALATVALVYVTMRRREPGTAPPPQPPATV